MSVCVRQHNVQPSKAFCLLRRFIASPDISGHRQAVASEPCGRGKACQAFLWGRSTGVVACIQRACWRCAKPCGALMQLVFCLLTFQSFRLKRALATAVLAISPPPPALMLWETVPELGPWTCLTGIFAACSQLVIDRKL